LVDELMASILELMNNTQAGFAEGRERAKKASLAGLFSQALSAQPDQRPALYNGIAQAGGIDAVTGVHKAISEMDEERRDEFGRIATAFDALPDDQKEAAYPELARRAQQMRIPVPSGPYDSKYGDSISRIALAYSGKSGAPAGYQEFGLLTNAAGYKPGTPEYEHAAQVRLGTQGRAPNGGFGFDTFTGDDGRERQTITDPRTGRVYSYDEAAGGFLPLGGVGDSVGQGPSPPQGTDDPFAFLAGSGATVTSGPRTPEHNAEVGGVPNSYHLTDQARDILPPRDPQQAAYIRQQAAANGLEIIDEGDHWHLEPRARPGMGVGRTKEEEAGRVKAAEYAAQADAAPLLGRIDAKNEALKARATADVQRDTVGGIEGNKQLGADAAKTFQTIRESGQAGIKERARLLVLRDSLGKTYTGPGANSLLTLKRVANAFGIKVEGLGEGEAARGLSNHLALSLRNPAGGEGMPGAMSDADREFLRQSTPGLQNSPQGWKALVNIRIGLANAAVEQAQYAEQLRRKGVAIIDIPGMVQEYANQHPIFQVHDSAARRNALLEKY
jgi:hypothetical protein